MENIKKKIKDNCFSSNGSLISRKNCYDIFNEDEKKIIYELKTIYKEFNLKEIFYILLNNLSEKDVYCKCGNRKKFINMKVGFTKYCNIKCKERHKDVAEKNKKILLEKYNVTNPTYLPQTKENHWSKKNKTKEVAEKIKKAKSLHDEIKKNEIKEKRKKSNLKKYGVENIFQDNEYIKEKFKEKYDVENPMQVKEIFEKQQKNAFKVKKVEKYGKQFTVRGYEDKFINELTKEEIEKIEQNYKIKYNYKGKEKIYYADFKIDNKIYEIKSIYTLKKDLEKNIAKMQISLKKYNFYFIIYENENKKIISNFYELYEILEKNYITQYNIFECFKEKKDRILFLNIIRRNLKPKFRSNYLYKGEIKQNIGYYSLEEILNLLYYRAKKHKSYNKIYNLYKTFIEFIKQKPYKLNKQEKMIIFNFPKPKYYRKGWKKYKQLKDEINRLKKVKRTIRKKYFGNVLEEKLININKEIETLRIRRDEILLQLN